jgi:hypothetical protein
VSSPSHNEVARRSGKTADVRLSNLRSSIPDFLRAQAFEPESDEDEPRTPSVTTNSMQRAFSGRRERPKELFDDSDFTHQRWKESPSDAMERELMHGLDAHYVQDTMRSGKKDMIERSVSCLGVVTGPLSPTSPTSSSAPVPADENETQQHSRKDSERLRKRDGFENSFSGAALELGTQRPTRLPPGTTFASPGYISGPATFPGSSGKVSATCLHRYHSSLSEISMAFDTNEGHQVCFQTGGTSPCNDDDV